MSAPAAKFRFVGTRRRVKEDRRFVAGRGRFAADVAIPDTLHVAVLSSEHPAARIVSIDASAALHLPGVHEVVTGAEIAEAVNPMMIGVDAPNVRRFPLAIGQVRYAGEWVAAVVAESRAVAEDARDLVRVEYEPLPFVLDPEEAYGSAGVLVHPAHGSNVLLDKRFIWGDVDVDFARATRKLAYRVSWGRNSTVPVETFQVTASWDAWRETLDVWASIQMPKYADQIARALRIPLNCVHVHNDVDVGGSYGVKRGIKQTVLAAYLSRKLCRPVRFIEDRLENMRGGDMQGPERIFDVELAFSDDGIIHSMKMRALDNVGAYAGRAPFQLGKPVGAIVGPYRIKSVEYHAISVMTNKAMQEAVRGFGQSPTNYAIETGIERVARELGIDRITVRKRNFIRKEEFPYLIPSGTRYDSGDYHTVVDKTLEHVDWLALKEERDRLRREGWIAGIGMASCLEPGGGNSSFEPLLNPKNDTTTWMESCRLMVDALGNVAATMHTTSSGQGHETLLSTVIGEALEIDPDNIRVIRPDSTASLPTNSPVGSRMAVMLGGAGFGAAQKLKDKLIRIAAHDLGIDAEQLAYQAGDVVEKDGSRRRTWAELVHIAHRNHHRLPPGMEPGLAVAHVMQVPTGGELPTADGRVQMYPVHAFEFHVVLVRIDPEIGKPEILRYVVGHDCGTVINPAIVDGMTRGGVAHGIGAALFEEFVYDAQGQMVAQTFADYLLPSSQEVPKIEIVHHCTPSPFTVFGQKGSGESGYLGGPAAIASAINDAVAPLKLSFDRLPIRIAEIGDAVAAVRLSAKKRNSP